MLALRSPQDAYRKVDFDARVEGADPGALVALCYEQLIAALGSAAFAHEHCDNGLKSKSLTRALAAITALQMGVSGASGVADALRRFYEAARRTILDSALTFDANALAAIRQDCADILRAMQTAR